MLEDVEGGKGVVTLPDLKDNSDKSTETFTKALGAQRRKDPL